MSRPVGGRDYPRNQPEQAGALARDYLDEYTFASTADPRRRAASSSTGSSEQAVQTVADPITRRRPTVKGRRGG